MNINTITNTNYKILNHLYNIMDGENIAHITQEELAENFQLSRATINKIIKELKNSNYITTKHKKLGRYKIENNTIKLIRTLRRLRNE